MNVGGLSMKRKFIDKIDFDKIEKITRLVFHTAWEIANRDERLKLKEGIE